MQSKAMNNFSLTNFTADYGQITSLVKEDGSIWFHAAQLLANTGTKTTTTQAKTTIEERLGDGHNILIPISDSLGRTQETLFFSESAATWYLSRSRTEAGKALDRKLHVEILPQIRRTGAYQSQPEQPKSEKPRLRIVPPQPKALTMRQHAQAADYLLGLIPNLDSHRKALLKATAMVEAFPSTKALVELTIANLPALPPTEQTFTPTELGRQRDPQIGPQAMNKVLESAELQTSYRTASDALKWKPTEKGMEFARISIESKSNGAPTEAVRWTAEVLEYLSLRVVAEGKSYDA
jgi:prophage antirepressor-like protein